MNDGFGPRLAVTTWYFDNAELAEMGAKEAALVLAVKEWSDRCLVWDESLRDSDDESDKQGQLLNVNLPLDASDDETLADAEHRIHCGYTRQQGMDTAAEQRKRGWMGAVQMHTARARFRNDADTPVPPSAEWWTAGLLASFRGAVKDPVRKAPPLLSLFMLKTINLPRQAGDKRRISQVEKREAVSLGSVVGTGSVYVAGWRG